MNHEEIAQHLRLAEIAGIRIKLGDGDNTGLYTDQGMQSERWNPFEELEQAYLILSRVCELHDAGDRLVTWTLERQITIDGFPVFVLGIEIPSKGTGPMQTSGSGAAIAICRGLLRMMHAMGEGALLVEEPT